MDLKRIELFSPICKTGILPCKLKALKEIILKMSRTTKQNCLNCQKEFDAPNIELNRGNGKFCSISCGAKYRTNLKSIQIKQREPNVICAQCQTLFYKSEYKQSQSKSGLYFCNRNCKDTAQRIGGIKEIQPPHYGDGSYTYRKIAIRKAKAIDPNISCTRCGWNKLLEVLEVHHKDRNRKNNVSDNLEILCPNCHMEDHFLNQDGRYSKTKKGSAS